MVGGCKTVVNNYLLSTLILCFCCISETQLLQINYNDGKKIENCESIAFRLVSQQILTVYKDSETVVLWKFFPVKNLIYVA